MKILQINSCVNMYSTGRIVEDIGIAIIEQGWESYVAYGRAARESQSQLIKIGSNFDIRMHGIQTRLFDKQGLASVKATKKFISEIKSIEPDLIHIHNIHDYYINYPLLFNYLASANIPIVWTFHDAWPFTGHCAQFSLIACEKWKTACYACPQKNKYPSSYLLDRSKQNYNIKKRVFNSAANLTIVPVSKFLGTLVQSSFLSQYPMQVINNGIDLTVFKPQIQNYEIRIKYNIGNKMMLLGAATAWSVSKGLNDYFLLSERLNKDEVIVLVGLKDEHFKNLPANIIGIKRTEDLNELVALYSTSDIVLNLSYQETFGLTTAEGLACGTPGIVYNCTASPELLTEKTGFVVAPGDIDAVLKAIATIKKNGKSLYSKDCRERAELFYNKDERYGDYIELYKSLL